MSFRTRWDDWKPPSRPRVVGVVGEVSGPFCEVNPPEGGQSFADGPQKDPTAPTTSPSPAAQIDREWEAARAEVDSQFSRHGVTASTGSRDAATWLAMELARGWDENHQIDANLAREWLNALVTGKSIGRLTDSGRPVIRVAGRAGHSTDVGER